MKVRSNLVGGVASILFAAALFIIIPSQIDQTIMGNEYISSRLVPQLIAGVIALCGFVLVFKSLVIGQEQIREISLPVEKRAILFFIMMLAFLFAVSTIGFLAAGLGMAAAALLFQRVRSARQYLIVLVVIAVVYSAFVHGLQVPLPEWGT